MTDRDAKRWIARHTKVVVSKCNLRGVNLTLTATEEERMPSKTDALSMPILSQDTLRGTKITHEMSEGWDKDGPFFVQSQANNRTLRGMVKRGPVPPGLRCAVWTSSIMSECNPHEPISYAESFGTLGKVSSLEHSYGLALLLKETFPDQRDDVEDTVPPHFGLDDEQMKDLLKKPHGVGAIPVEGIRSLTRLLTAVHQVLGVEYCPLLPDIAAIFLNYMPESHAFAVIKEILHDSAHYLPFTQEEHYSHCTTFALIIRKLYPGAAEEMERCGALSPEGLDPIFRRFFVPILKYEHVLQFMDLFVTGGMKVLMQVASALIQVVDEKFNIDQKIHNADAFWRAIRDYVRGESFDFDQLVKKAYGLHGSTGVGKGRLLRRQKFPRRQTIARMVRYNQSNENVSRTVVTEPETLPTKPMDLVSCGLKAELASSVPVRSYMARWLPPIYQNCKLELIYSTNIHGRTLSQFYYKLARTKHTLTFVQVRGTESVIGMFANQAWRPMPLAYGDGECFLFRVTPDPKCFKWKPDGPGAIDDESDNEEVREQFMVSRDTFLTMGLNKDGSSGLRLNENLTRGESSPALGFNNEPLAGEKNTEFDVGLVEVYGLVHEVDDKAVGREDKGAARDSHRSSVRSVRSDFVQ